MALSLIINTTALGAGLTTSCLGVGGTAPYTYSLAPLGAGGSINPVTGLYTAPLVLPTDPSKIYDQVIVTDAVLATATGSIMVGSALLLFCDIMKQELSITDDHIYLWDQKVFQPTDSKMYMAVAIASSKPFGNTNFFDGTTNRQIQSVNMLDVLSVDFMSRSAEARDRKAEVIMALNSQYAESQQEINSFRIGILPAGGNFTNLSEIDGAAIPYRFNIAINLQYFVTKVQSSQYYDKFPTTAKPEPSLLINS